MGQVVKLRSDVETAYLGKKLWLRRTQNVVREKIAGWGERYPHRVAEWRRDLRDLEDEEFEAEEQFWHDAGLIPFCPETPDA